MSKKREQKLLEVISKDQLPLDQQDRWSDVDIVHKLLREPRDIHELKHCKDMMAILHDSGTLIFVFPGLWRNLGLPRRDKSLILTFYEDGKNICTMTCAITGPSDDAIADTATFLWSLHHPENNKNSSLAIRNSGHGSGFDFRAIRQEQLARMFEKNPTRHVEFSHLTISAEQSVILATMIHPVHLRFGCFSVIEDNGDALTSALQNRQSPFGYLNFSAVNCNDDKIWLSDSNVQRILQIPFINELVLDGCFSDDLIPFIFSSPIETVRVDDCHGRISQRVAFSPGVLSLEMSWRSAYPSRSIFSDLSHLEHRDFAKLSVFISLYDKACDADIKELIRFIATKSNLRILRWGIPLKSAEILKNLFTVAEHHKGLGTLQMMEFPYTLDQRHKCLANLIKRNRAIHVTDLDGDLVANGNDMHMTHSLNRFYCGLPNLGKEPQAIRPALVREALIHSANKDFQRCALLLAKQTDSLCDFVLAISEDMLESSFAHDDDAERTIQANVPELSSPEVHGNEWKRESRCCCEQTCKRAKI